MTMVATMQYRDASAAIDFLCHAFGFARHLVVPGEDGTIAHAQLTYGRGMIMLGSVTNTPFGNLMRQPDQVGGETRAVYVVVPDIDAHYARAKAAGAEIMIDIVDQPYGGRDYTCRDPQGHVWAFGSYDPWADAAS